MPCQAWATAPRSRRLRRSDYTRRVRRQGFTQHGWSQAFPRPAPCAAAALVEAQLHGLAFRPAARPSGCTWRKPSSPSLLCSVVVAQFPPAYAFAQQPSASNFADRQQRSAPALHFVQTVPAWRSRVLAQLVLGGHLRTAAVRREHLRRDNLRHLRRRDRVGRSPGQSPAAAAHGHPSSHRSATETASSARQPLSGARGPHPDLVPHQVQVFRCFRPAIASGPRL